MPGRLTKRGNSNSNITPAAVQWRMISNRIQWNPPQYVLIFFQNHHIKINQSQVMRQINQSSSHQEESNEKVESLGSRKERIDKKRTIRKNKIQKTIEKSTDEIIDSPIHSQTLTKEEKMMIQKVRNRQAAQRSREIHKKYVEDLQKENLDLKTQLKATSFICKHCQKRNILGECGANTDSEGTKQLESEMELQAENEDYSRINDFMSQDEQNFVRASPSGKSSLFGILFILCIVSVCLFSVGPSTHSNKRVLIQTTPKNTQASLFENDQKNINLAKIMQYGPHQYTGEIQRNGIEDNGIVPIGFKFSPFDKDICLQSILKGSQPNALYYQKKHLTTNTRHIGFPPSFSATPNLLFCQSPKVYRSNNPKSSIISNLLNIIISGSQMMEILTHTHLPLTFDKIVQFDGIYRISAEVKEIVRVQDHNCLV